MKQNDEGWIPLTITPADLAARLRAAKIEGIELARKLCAQDFDNYFTAMLERAALDGEL